MSESTRRGPGRPRLVDGETTDPVTIRLPASLHDRACEVALREGISVRQVLRAAISAYLTGFVTTNTST